MPLYEYQCDSCGLKVEKLWRLMSVAKTKGTIPCEECGTDMRKLVSAASFAFKHGTSQTRGALPPNTGTSDDFNYDKAIGRDAEQKWKVHEQRNSVKDSVIRDERRAGRAVTREQLVPTSEGYRTITEPERVRANQNRETAFKIANAAKTSGDSPKQD
jgi:putative FmdB family regulatory protein